MYPYGLDIVTILLEEPLRTQNKWKQNKWKTENKFRTAMDASALEAFGRTTMIDSDHLPKPITF